ncbi:MAG: hypothetical protein HY862_01715 [Chloroflexi bacterium]|nr:hypothetical protein [Chloroflexota bacterium]
MPLSSLSDAQIYTSTEKRDVKKVPFVELLENRLQGIVSSGSDIERVYVSYFEAGSLNYCCSTNNNRPCGGLRGSPCGHLGALLDEAIIQFGFETVGRFLHIDMTQTDSAQAILTRAGHNTGIFAGEIFSRFLSDLELLELPNSHIPLSAMTWFNG